MSGHHALRVIALAATCAVVALGTSASASAQVAKLAIQPVDRVSIPTSEVLLQLSAGDIGAVAAEHGLVLTQPLDFAPGMYLLSAPSPEAARTASVALAADPRVALAEQQVARQRFTRAAPNDPSFGNQWHLRNTGQSGGLAGVDVDVVGTWDFTLNQRLGTGVNIAIVDDGVQIAHPDLAPNYRSALSYDFNGNDTNPTPASGNTHGTSCAGVAAAFGNNSIGVSGAAPRAGIAGIRILGAAVSDATEGLASTFQNNNQSGQGSNHIYSNSWGPADDGNTLEAPGPAMTAALAAGATQGRGGRGSIFLWAGGNGRGSADNSNYDGYANNRNVIAVAAADNLGRQSSYSEDGANIFVSAPSNGGTLGITTTSTATGYTSSFGGTSSATPLAAGVVALMLEAKPNLTARDVKHILARSSRVINGSDGSWVTNAAGRTHSQRFGFGVADAQAAVALAQTWNNVGPLMIASVASSPTLNLAIPDNTTTYISTSLTLTRPMVIETVEITVDLVHPYQGDLDIQLTGPTGITSILAVGGRSASNGTGYRNWTFTSVRHWDENAIGTWTLALRDRGASDLGTLNNWSLRFYGSALAIPEPASIGMLLIPAILLRRRR
jgi:subtilisin-like proprotein convertase family protein